VRDKLADVVVVKREPSPALIEVKVKVEDCDDELKHVLFTKSEDGMLDIWNLEILTFVQRLQFQSCSTKDGQGKRSVMYVA